MNDKIRELIEEIEEMKVKLGEEIDAQESAIAYEIQNGYVKFEKDVLQKQKENMKNLFAYFREVPLIHFLTAPLIYGMIVPALFLDGILFIYQQVVFRVFKFKLIQRSDYIVYDRHYLAYLNPVEKLNCLYCSYFNGLMQYAAAIASRTEFYFCPIKHAKKIVYDHAHYQAYLAYGDEENYHEKLKELREKEMLCQQ